MIITMTIIRVLHNDSGRNRCGRTLVAFAGAKAKAEAPPAAAAVPKGNGRQKTTTYCSVAAYFSFRLEPK